jgi:hypothetical protein
MLYLFEYEDKIYVSSINPIGEEDFEKVLQESFIAMMDSAKTIPEEIQIGVIRNVLTNGGAKVVILE